MTTYSISQQGIRVLQRRWLVTISVICVVALAVVVGLSWPTMSQTSSGLLGAITPLAFFVLILPIIAYRQLGQQLAVWKSIRVELGPDYVARQQMRIAPLRIQRSEITRIQELNGSLCIFTVDKYRTLVIPAGLDGYNEIKVTLSTWNNIESPTTDKARKSLLRYWLLVAALLIGVVILFISTDWWLVIPVAVVLVAVMLYSAVVTFRLKGIDPRQKRSLAFGVLLIVFIAVLKIVASLTPFLQPR